MRGVRRQRQRRQQRLALAIPQRLRRRTPCAIAIACNAFWTRVRIRTQFKKLERTGLTRFFSVILTSGEYGIAKPDPRIFQEACRRAAVAATDAVYVGDDWSLDIVGSLGAGLQPIWVRRGATGPRDIPAQIRVVTDLSALPATLASSRGI
jgi:putative hydrolase of the HAD superfamily